MRARLEVATRLVVACLALLTLAAVGGCGGGGGGSRSSSGISFTKGALTSLPLVKPPAPGAGLRLAADVLPPADIGSDWFTAQLFKMECREAAGNQGVDYCPAGTPPQSDYGTALGSDPYAFDMQALVGFVYAAQMYTSLVKDCTGTGLAARTVSSTDYFAASSDGAADPTRFIFDQFGTYTCRSTQVSDPAHETRMVSADASGSYQTTLHTRYKYVAGGQTQTDFFQMDVSMDDAGAPAFLAFNFASAAPFSSRLVLLVNLTNHTFAMKYYTPQQPSVGGPGGSAPERYAVAAGTAGYDLATGEPNAGSYAIHFQDDPGEFVECVNNADGSFQPFTACDADLDHTAWTPAAIQAFLGVPDATAARIGDYLAAFDGTGDLAVADAWTDAMEQTAQRDLYWPAGLN